ncbi:unnamed protein product, partial [Phaeothamnion confervicola]
SWLAATPLDRRLVEFSPAAAGAAAVGGERVFGQGHAQLVEPLALVEHERQEKAFFPLAMSAAATSLLPWFWNSTTLSTPRP